MPWHILPAAGLLPVFRMHAAPFLGTGTGQMQVNVPSGGAPAIIKKEPGGGGVVGVSRKEFQLGGDADAQIQRRAHASAQPPLPGCVI